ncbi:hypothetical protein B0H14DRAFT_3043610, partial [Mycena olivaceomarginata]
HDARRRVLGTSSLVSFWSSSLCLRCVHLTTIPASATSRSDPPPTTSISLSPRSTRLLAAASSHAQVRVAPGGMVRL